ncbi:MAG: hypothetical protein AB2L24_33225 [Mangrovibacterium sp.]
MKNKYYTIRLLMLLCLSFLVSCEDETSPDDIPDQLFRPVAFTASVNSNIVTLSWVPIANATYSLEISRDSLLFENDIQVFSLDKAEEYMIEDLWSNSRYSARIKAISKNASINNSEYNQITFKTGSENIFYAIADEDIEHNSVLLRWDKNKNVDKIIVSTTGGIDVTIPLSAEDKSAGEKLIGNLEPGTYYGFKIYLGEMPRGSVSATTDTV